MHCFLSPPLLSADGCMFEIRAKDNPVLIEAFHVHMFSKTDNVAVYYRPGQVDYRYDESYQLIYEAPNVEGAGKGHATNLPPFNPPVVVNPGTPMTFYVSVTNTSWEAANLYYTEGEGSGTVMASDNNINVIEGMATNYPWRGYALDVRWNGYIHYRLQPQPTSSPTESPTISLSTTSSPTNQPTHKPTRQPTNPPTSKPTSLPTNSPSPKPTSQPTNPPTPNPTRQPTWGPTNSPTKSPVVARTPYPTDLNPSPTTTNPTASPSATQTGSPSLGTLNDAGIVDAPTPTITIEPTATEAASTETNMPSGTQAPNDPTDEPSLSPTGEGTFPPTKTGASLLPDFVPTSASMKFNNCMGMICPYFFPLFIIAIFFL